MPEEMAAASCAALEHTGLWKPIPQGLYRATSRFTNIGLQVTCLFALKACPVTPQ